MLILKPKSLVGFCLLIFFLKVKEIYILLLIIQYSIYCHSIITQLIHIFIAKLLKVQLYSIYVYKSISPVELVDVKLRIWEIFEIHVVAWHS